MDAQTTPYLKVAFGIGSARNMLGPVIGPNSADRARQWPAFDGVRAVAVVAVMIFHADYPHFIKGGYVGVDIFFVLSGFLITWLLTTRHDQYLAASATEGSMPDEGFGSCPRWPTLIVTAVILVLTDGGLAPFRHEAAGRADALRRFICRQLG